MEIKLNHGPLLYNSTEISADKRKISANIYRHMYRQMRSLLADNGHIDRYIVQLADIVQSANDRISADYRQYRIG